MTEEEVKAILVGISACWNELSRGEVKSLLRILAAHGTPPVCSACGKPIYDFKDFSWDHCVARSLGGPDTILNMTPMHIECNVEKGSKVDADQFKHIDPELLKEIKPNCKGKPQRKSKKFTETPHRRNHVRLNGWSDNNNRRSRSR